MSKGDWLRPVKNRKAFEDNWDRIFKRDSDKRAQPKPQKGPKGQ